MSLENNNKIHAFRRCQPWARHRTSLRRYKDKGNKISVLIVYWETDKQENSCTLPREGLWLSCRITQSLRIQEGVLEELLESAGDVWTSYTCYSFHWQSQAGQWQSQIANGKACWRSEVFLLSAVLTSRPQQSGSSQRFLYIFTLGSGPPCSVIEMLT